MLAHEQTIKQRFANIVPTLKRIAGLQHATDFVEQAQAIAQQELGFELPEPILADAWATDLDMRALYGASVFSTLRLLADQTRVTPPPETSELDEAMSFMLDCGYHAVDISPCSDGRDRKSVV